MLPVRFDPPAARYIKKLKDKRLKKLYQKAIDEIREDCFFSDAGGAERGRGPARRPGGCRVFDGWAVAGMEIFIWEHYV